MLGIIDCLDCPAPTYKYWKTKTTVVGGVLKTEEISTNFWIPEANSNQVLSFKTFGSSNTHNYSGFSAADKFCIVETGCTNKINLFAVTKWSQFQISSAISGYLAMAAGNNNNYNATNLLVRLLKTEAHISAAIFSISWDMAGTQTIDFGPPNATKLVVTQLVYIPVSTHKTFGLYWSNKVNGFQSFDGKYYITDEFYAFTDITLTAIIVPREPFLVLKSQFLQQIVESGYDLIYGATYSCGTA